MVKNLVHVFDKDATRALKHAMPYEIDKCRVQDLFPLKMIYLWWGQILTKYNKYISEPKRNGDPFLWDWEYSFYLQMMASITQVEFFCPGNEAKSEMELIYC